MIINTVQLDGIAEILKCEEKKCAWVIYYSQRQKKIFYKLSWHTMNIRKSQTINAYIYTVAYQNAKQKQLEGEGDA